MPASSRAGPLSALLSRQGVLPRGSLHLSLGLHREALWPWPPALPWSLGRAAGVPPGSPGWDGVSVVAAVSVRHFLPQPPASWHPPPCRPPPSCLPGGGAGGKARPGYTHTHTHTHTNTLLQPRAGSHGQTHTVTWADTTQSHSHGRVITPHMQPGGDPLLTSCCPHP